MSVRNYYEKYKGHLAIEPKREVIGVICGYDRDSTVTLIMAIPRSLDEGWESTMLDSDDYVDPNYLKVKEYQFIYVSVHHVVPQPIKRIRMKTLEELAEDPSVTINYCGNEISGISHCDSTTIINAQMAKGMLDGMFKAPIDGDKLVVDGWTLRPWMYVDLDEENENC